MDDLDVPAWVRSWLDRGWAWEPPDDLPGGQHGWLVKPGRRMRGDFAQAFDALRDDPSPGGSVPE